MLAVIYFKLPLSLRTYYCSFVWWVRTLCVFVQKKQLKCTALLTINVFKCCKCCKDGCIYTIIFTTLLAKNLEGDGVETQAAVLKRRTLLYHLSLSEMVNFRNTRSHNLHQRVQTSNVCQEGCIFFLVHVFGFSSFFSYLSLANKNALKSNSYKNMELKFVLVVAKCHPNTYFEHKQIVKHLGLKLFYSFGWYSW